MAGPDTDHLGSIRARLTELEAERGVLIKRLHRLQGIQALGNERTADHASITVESSASEKINSKTNWLSVVRHAWANVSDIFPSIFTGDTLGATQIPKTREIEFYQCASQGM